MKTLLWGVAEGKKRTEAGAGDALTRGSEPFLQAAHSHFTLHGHRNTIRCVTNTRGSPSKQYMHGVISCALVLEQRLL